MPVMLIAQRGATAGRLRVGKAQRLRGQERNVEECERFPGVGPPWI